MKLQDLVKNIRVFGEFCDSLFHSLGGGYVTDEVKEKVEFRIL